ncbi:MAG: patatin-like phospholipase family protein [Deltaproteobacteria bacterium]|nr:patatin-like phospholipase family protein [Deltaproteobacteria bacterium]
MLRRRHRAIRPLEEMEVQLVRACLESPGWLTRRQEHRIRYALSLARLTEVRTADGRDIDLSESLSPYRQRLIDTLSPLLRDGAGLVEKPEVASLEPVIWELAREQRDELMATSAARLPWEDVDREIRKKELVLACGGGGGVGYVYLGAFHALEDAGLIPALISGTSIGAILGAFRARHKHFDAARVVEVVQALSWSKLFSPVSLKTRYGLPGPLRLYLRAGIGEFLQDDPDRPPLAVKELAIPMLITIAGIRRGEMPHSPEWYEHGFKEAAPGAGGLGGIGRTRRLIAGLWRTLSDFVQHPEMLKPLVAGADPLTAEFDLLDALGFSAAVPGLIHYDIARQAPDTIALLEEILEREGIGRLIDGGLVDNVPARSAWRAVQAGKIGHRNALVVAMDGFAPKLTAPIWIPIQRLAQQNVRGNLRYAHVVMTFLKTLSPIDLVPSVANTLKAVRAGREEFSYELPLIARLLEPLEAHEDPSP